MEIKRILFPVDLAGSSHKIVPQVTELADKFDAEIHLLFVVGTFEEYSTFFVPHPSIDLMEIEGVKRAEEKITEFAENYFQDNPRVVKVVLRGNPVEEIRKYIGSAGIDLVVVTAHDRRGLQRAIFGSIAEEIIRTSPVPVLSINPELAEARLPHPIPVGKRIPPVHAEIGRH